MWYFTIVLLLPMYKLLKNPNQTFKLIWSFIYLHYYIKVEEVRLPWDKREVKLWYLHTIFCCDGMVNEALVVLIDEYTTVSIFFT